MDVIEAKTNLLEKNVNEVNKTKELFYNEYNGNHLKIILYIFSK